MASSNPGRRALAVIAALLMGLGLLLAGPVSSASAANDPYNTGVTVSPLKYGCEAVAATCNNVGTTNSYFNGEDIKLLYTQNFYCDSAVTGTKASSGCEAGAKYTKLPPGTAAGAIDPLYIPIPLFAPAPSYVQCTATPMCIDHPGTIDLSRIAAALPGSPPPASLINAMLPGHDHIITTRNEDKPEWWPVVAVGVTTQAAWNTITTAKDYATMKALEGVAGSGVTGEIPTNVFLWFQTLPGHITSTQAHQHFNQAPPAATGGKAIDNLVNDCTSGGGSCGYVGQTRSWLGDAGTAQGSDVNLLYSSPFFCDSSVQKSGANPCEAGQKPSKVPADITSNSFTDPLYIPTPLFKQPVNDLQCATGKDCIDHPMTADLSRLAATLGAPASALANFMLPGHDHIITDRNDNKPEWWPVTVIGVTNPASFALISRAHSYAEVKKLEANPANGVLEVPTNIYLFFQTVPGTGLATAAFDPIPVGPPATGGGSTAGLQHTPLIGFGVFLLLAAGGALLLSRRRLAGQR